MKFALHVTAPPYSSQSHLSALRFAEALAETDHELTRVFFSGDAVTIANRLVVTPQGEQDLAQRWRLLADKLNTELIICVSASLQRGIIDKAESERYEKPCFTASEPFIISGLGQLVEACLLADRVITFGH